MEAKHTHRSTGGQSTPDMTFAHHRLAQRTSWQTIEDRGSDHLPILIKIRIGCNRRKRQQTKSWKKNDWEKFTSTTEELFNRQKMPKGTNRAATWFAETIKKADKLAIPAGKIRDPKPWWNDKVEEAVKLRNEARASAHLGEDERKAWNQACRHATKIRKTEKTAWWNSYASELSCRTDPRKVKQTIDNIEGAPPRTDNAALAVRGKLFTSDKAKAEEFMKEYAAVSTLPQDKRDRETRKRNRKRLAKDCKPDNSGLSSPFTAAELKQALGKMRNGKAAGDDGVYNEHLRHLGTKGKEVFLTIVNQSWKQSFVPRNWRKATIIPIKKPGKPPGEIGSHRPISLTSCVAKLVERMVKNRLYWWLETNKKLTPNQCGFRSKRSTTDHIARLQQIIHDGYQEKPARKSILVLFDMRRAFDTVWIPGLIHKLLEKGIPNRMIKWIQAFLDDRRAKVKINQTESRYRRMKAGVPQGSVIAPLLFLVYVDYLAQRLESKGIHVFLFADDLAVLIEGKTVRECERKANQISQEVLNWAQEWRMQLAAEKTTATLFSTTAAEANTKLNIKLGTEDIETTKLPKFLGIKMDRLFSYTEHCKDRKRKAGEGLRLMARLAGTDFGAKMEDLALLEKTYIRSKTDYAGEAWMPAACDTALNHIDVVQRSAARWVTGGLRNTNGDVLHL